METYFREKAPIVRDKRLIDELYVFIWNGNRAEAQRGYNDDLVLSWAIALWIRDTALRLKQQGMDLTRSSVSHIGKYSPVYNANEQNKQGWDWNPGGKDNEDLTWLLG